MKSLTLSQPHMILMVGVPGSGKTFFAEKFSTTFHAPYLSARKLAELSGAPTAAVKALFSHQLDEFLKSRQSIIVEGFSETRSGRTELMAKAKKAGYQTLIVWVQVDQATAQQRLAKAAKQAGVEFSLDLYDRAMKRFTAPAASDNPTVVSGKHTYATQAKVVLKKLSAPRAEISTHSVAPVRPAQPGRHNITVR